MQVIKNILWAIVFLVGLSIALDAAGIDLSNDYDGKQVITELECQKRGVKTTSTANSTLWQTELVCKEK